MVTHLLFFFLSQTHLLKINMTQSLFLAIYCVRIIITIYFLSCLDHQGLACKIIGVWCVKSLDYSTEPFRGRHTLESHWTSKYYILHSTVNGAIIV